MDKDPSVILAEIAQTRDRVGNEVDALSYKTDVGARVGDYVDEKTEAVKSKLTGAVDSVTSVTPDQRTITRGATHVRDTAESNPLGLVLGGLAVGFLVGTLLPSTRFENSNSARHPIGGSMPPRKQRAMHSTEASRSPSRRSTAPSTLRRTKVASRARS